MSIESEIDAWAAAHPAPPEPVTCDTSPDFSEKTDLLSQPSGQFRPFPLHCLPAPIEHFVREIARVKSIDPAMIALPTLGVLSASLGNARRLRLRSDYAVPAVLWCVAVADSGDGKSPAFRAALAPLLKLQGEAVALHTFNVSTHAEAVARWEALPKSDRGEPPAPPEPMRHFYLSDSTTEAIGLRLRDNPRGLLVALDEWAGLIKSFGAYKGGAGSDRESWLSFYDAGAAKIDRKTSTPPTIYVPAAFVATMGTIQGPMLRRLISPEIVGCGLAARLLIAQPPARRRAWVDDDPDAGAIEGYADTIGALTRLGFDPEAGPGLITPASAAMGLWREWWAVREDEKLREVDPGLKASIPKITDAAARLALIIHSIHAATGTRGVDPWRLDEATMQHGIELAAWFDAEARRVYRTLAGDDETDRLRRFVEVIRREGGAVRVRDWARSRHITAAEAEAELGDLIRAGLGGLWTIETRGRPATVFALKGVDPRSACDTSPDFSEKTDLLSHCHKGDAAHAQAEPDDPERDEWLDHLAGQDAPLDVIDEGGPL